MTTPREQPPIPKLSEAQWKWLDLICRSNGGGVTVAITSKIPTPVRKLYELGLVQGKGGQQHCAVHTRAGLAYWRATLANACEAQ